MNKIIDLVRKKSQLVYDINCIKRYINDMEYDENLKDAWDKYNKELLEIEKEIELLIKPEIFMLEKRKEEILNEIKHKEEEIYILKCQLFDVDKVIEIYK